MNYSGGYPAEEDALTKIPSYGQVPAYCVDRAIYMWNSEIGDKQKVAGRHVLSCCLALTTLNNCYISVKQRGFDMITYCKYARQELEVLSGC